MPNPRPDVYRCASGGVIAGGRSEVPSWAPTAGQIKTISYAAGTHPLGAGATLAEIDPANQAWNPNSPSQGPYGGGDYYWTTALAYCGGTFNSDTRELVDYTAGHSAINVPAPFGFGLTDLRWKWFDTPLPFDGFGAYRNSAGPVPPNQSQIEAYYPAAQYDYAWGDLDGDWTGWGANGRPGKIQPVPGHSRAKLLHIPAAKVGNTHGALLNTMVPTGSLSGVNARGTWVFDYDAQDWARAAQAIPAAAPSHSAGIAYDATTDKAVLVGNTSASATAYVFNRATGLWTTRTASNSIATCVDVPGNVLHQASRLYIVQAARKAGNLVADETNGITYEFYACLIDDIVGAGAFSWTLLNVAVTTAWPLNGAGYNHGIGFQYCPVDGCLYAVNGTHGSTKYWRLSPPAGATTTNDYLTGQWTLDELTFASGSLSSPGGVQSVSFLRLAWDTPARAFIWYSNSINGPVQAFRPEGL